MERIAKPPDVAPIVRDLLLAVSTTKIAVGLPAWIKLCTAAMVRPSGDQRGCFNEPFSDWASSPAPCASAPIVQIAALRSGPLELERTNAILRPSGDQSPSSASSTTFASAPPAIGIL